MCMSLCEHVRLVVVGLSIVVAPSPFPRRIPLSSSIGGDGGNDGSDVREATG